MKTLVAVGAGVLLGLLIVFGVAEGDPEPAPAVHHGVDVGTLDIGPDVFLRPGSTVPGPAIGPDISADHH